MQEKKEKMNQLARDVLILSRNTLLVNLRFLDMALSQFEYLPIEKLTLLTDGRHIFYNPRHILKKYKEEKESVVRDYLHMVMHCVFRHMYMNPSLNRAYWDFACDIAVENVISDLGIKSVTTKLEAQKKQYIDLVKKSVKQLTAEKIYHFLRENVPNEEGVEKLRQLFCSDNHELWYMTVEEIEMRLGIRISQKGTGGADSQEQQENNNDDAKQRQSSLSASFRMEIAQIWKNIGERMQVDLETFGKQRGLLPGGLTQNLQAVNREKYDYTSFLKKFAVMGEVMKVNDDEFDYVYYTYGLKLYEKVPLVEPLEYKEVKRIKEFVIAIDTSGSTSGELVQRFVQKTYNILKTTESFFTKINLHIIQCDADIQEDIKITTQEEFDQYLKNMKIRGLGGTDFRPVFQYVEKLRKAKEFTNLKGLIYFTDGYGAFPERKPEYETAFVYVNDEYNNPEVPAWAIKLVLEKEDI